MAKAKKVAGEKKLPTGAMIFNGNVKYWGSQDPKTFEYLTKWQCNNCGANNELREELPSRKKRDDFRLEAKSHNCDATVRSRQFLQAHKEYELGRRDLNG